MEQNSVIIVVPCRNLNEYVLECLRECSRLDYGAYRIALLPDGPVELPSTLKAAMVTVIPTGDVTIAAKRNAAIKRFPEVAYYACIDSDAYPSRDWLEQSISSFTRDDVWAVGGPCLSPPDEPVEQRVVGNATRSVLVSGNLAFSKRVSPSRYCLNLHSCNLIVSRAAIEQIGGFQEGLVTGEDRELCHRIRRAGGRIFFNGSARVFHHNRRLGMHFFSQRLVHGHSIFNIMDADPGWYNILLFVPLFGTALMIAGALIGLAYRTAWMIAGSAVASYLLLALLAASRHAGSAREAAMTWWAIVTSNAGYIIGSMLGLFRVEIDFKKRYDNYHSSRR